MSLKKTTKFEQVFVGGGDGEVRLHYTDDGTVVGYHLQLAASNTFFTAAEFSALALAMNAFKADVDGEIGG